MPFWILTPARRRPLTPTRREASPRRLLPPRLWHGIEQRMATIGDIDRLMLWAIVRDLPKSGSLQPATYCRLARYTRKSGFPDRLAFWRRLLPDQHLLSRS